MTEIKPEWLYEATAAIEAMTQEQHADADWAEYAATVLAAVAPMIEAEVLDRVGSKLERRSENCDKQAMSLDIRRRDERSAWMARAETLLNASVAIRYLKPKDQTNA